METIKLGSKGNAVRTLQGILGLTPDGSFGKQTEAAVKAFQKSKGLTADGIVGPSTWSLLTAAPKAIGEGVVYSPIKVHITKAPNRKIEYLVIHFTAGSTSAGDADIKTRNVFLSRSASADFVVDDDSMLQVNPDPKNYFCWAVGDGNGKYGVTNRNSISIEICSNLRKGTTPKYPNHEGWYFTEASLTNAIKLAKTIMKVYSIPITKVIRHYDASRKLCPGILGWNPGPIYNSITGVKTGKVSNEDAWYDFKNRLV